VLKIQDLVIRYHHIQAVKGISFEISKAEIVTLLGANGSGKSSILRAISGLVRPYEGHIIFNGKEITNIPPYDIVKLGIIHVPEGRGIFPNLKVIENLEIACYLRRDKKEMKYDLDYVFDLFPILYERQKQYGGTLSGGEQQMLAIGRALMARGKLILLDEPSLGLAPKVVESIFQTIVQINGQGIAILLVEQNARKALAIANRGYILETGNIVYRGQAHEVAGNQAIRKAYLGE
jgi:branched-chain amino acid transport system ATP-binding protein